jgi:hypothetical protein
MSLQGSDGSDRRFLSYVEGLASVIGHADRRRGAPFCGWLFEGSPGRLMGDGPAILGGTTSRTRTRHTVASVGPQDLTPLAKNTTLCDRGTTFLGGMRDIAE